MRNPFASPPRSKKRYEDCVDSGCSTMAGRRRRNRAAGWGEGGRGGGLLVLRDRETQTEETACGRWGQRRRAEEVDAPTMPSPTRRRHRPAPPPTLELEPLSTPPNPASAIRRRGSANGNLCSSPAAPGSPAGRRPPSRPSPARAVLTCAVAAMTAAGVLSSSGAGSSVTTPTAAAAGDAGTSSHRPLPSPESVPISPEAALASVPLSASRVGRGIGDMMRSSSSSALFFKSIDRDGDGTVRPTELAKFVRSRIGGSAFDAEDEVEEGVSAAMAVLDRDGEGGLDSSDVFAYWMQLESLLTAEEVAEWVVNAVQLPEYVGRIFKENVVTGYDFPELVENDGEALEKDLGIEKPSFRKKIVRHINARLLGIGTVPTPPNKVQHKLESCAAVSFAWAKSAARGFPVHGYRVQRRGIDLRMGMGGGINRTSKAPVPAPANAGAGECKAHDEIERSDGPGDVCNEVDLLEGREGKSKGGAAEMPFPSTTEWVTVYHGSDSDFVDAGLELGHNYVYRLQAWNSVGRSEWATVDISKALKKQRCSTNMGTGTGRSLFSDRTSSGAVDYGDYLHWPQSFFSGSFYLASIVMALFRGLLALSGLAAAMMRFRRASAKSTLSTSLAPAFPWLWRGVNALSVRCTGVEVVPHSLLGDAESRERESELHDQEIKAVGLHGYRERGRDSTRVGGEQDHRPGGKSCRRVMFQKSRKKSYSTGNLALLSKDLGGRTADRQTAAAGGGGGSLAAAAPIAAPKILRNKRTLSPRAVSEPLGAGVETCGECAPPERSASNVSDLSEPSVARSNPFRRSLRSRDSAASGSVPLNSRGGSVDDSEIGCPAPAFPRGVIPFKEASARTLSTGDETSPQEDREEDEDDDDDEDHNSATLSDRVTQSERLEYEDDHNVCNSCQKRYKFPKRFRHHCSRCMSTFCHRHGRTTHSNLMSCGLPGNCVCDVCLELESFNDRAVIKPSSNLSVSGRAENGGGGESGRAGGGGGGSVRRGKMSWRRKRAAETG